MATINYHLSSKMDKGTNKAQILVQVSLSRTFRVCGKTGIHVCPKDWDEKNMTIRTGSRLEKKDKQVELEELRHTLNKFGEHIRNIIYGTHNLNEMTDKKSRQEWMDYVTSLFYDPSIKLVKQHNLLFDDFAEVYMKIRSKEEHWEPAEKKTKRCVQEWKNPICNKLSAVRSQLKLMNPNLKMEEITPNTMDEYQDFLIKQGYMNTTVEKHICYFKQILKWAYERGYIKSDKIIAHKTPSLKFSKPKATNFLVWDEVTKMYKYQFSENEYDLELTRDRFVFCCATSLRHSDLDILKKNDFNQRENPTYFSFVSKKTSDDLTIYLNEISLELYNKYKDIETPDGLLFPKKSNQKMNANLKKIAKRLGLNREITKMQFCGKNRVEVSGKLYELIGTHSARKTFVIHGLEMGMTPQEIMSYTGHEEYDTMKPYIAVTDVKRKEKMQSCFQL